MPGTVIYEAHPAMFRAHPFWFILYVLLVAAFGVGIFVLRASDSKLLYELSALLIVAFVIGLILLLYWYIKTRATALTVTESELMYVRGILSKDRTAMSLKNVRSINIAQGFINRIFKVGTIQIYSAGDEPEFTIVDMPDPHAIRRAITKAQQMQSN